MPPMKKCGNAPFWPDRVGQNPEGTERPRQVGWKYNALAKYFYLSCKF